MAVAWRIEAHDSVTSTQDIIRGMAAMGDPEGVVIRAEEQTNGRGRHGRKWQGLPGNLFMSVLLRPSCSVQGIGPLSLLSGLAVAQAIRPYLRKASDLALKWPNDVMLGGDKCAGIILESGLTGNSAALEWLALGIGVNIAHHPRGEGACLADFCTRAPTPEALCSEILTNLQPLYLSWAREGAEQIRSAWLGLAHPRGTPLKVRVGPQIEQGIFHDIDSAGNLLIQDKELRLKTVSAGEVYL